MYNKTGKVYSLEYTLIPKVFSARRQRRWGQQANKGNNKCNNYAKHNDSQCHCCNNVVNGVIRHVNWSRTGLKASYRDSCLGVNLQGALKHHWNKSEICCHVKLKCYRYVMFSACNTSHYFEYKETGIQFLLTEDQFLPTPLNKYWTNI
jgi:hypothetical protein